MARILKTDIMADMDLKALAQLLQKSGRGNDTVLAHITKKEAERLKRDGGSGTINPDTGLPEFDDSGYIPIDTSGGGITTEAGQGTPVSEYQYQPQTSIDTTPQSAPIQTDYQQPAPSNVGNEQYNGPVYPPSFSGNAPITPNVNYPSMQAPVGALTDANLTASATEPQAEQQSIAARLSKALGIDEGNLNKYGLAGLQGLMGAYSTNKAQQQGQQAKAEQAKIAQPYQQQGKQLVDQAQRGELSAASKQQLQAAQAQVNQGVESRGGVGAAQANAQIETMREQLLNQQYQLGLQISGIGDQIAIGAIKAGMQADQYVNALTSNYFTNIARTAMGTTPQTTQEPQTPSNYGAKT